MDIRLYSDVVEALGRGLAAGEAGAGGSPEHRRTALITSRLVNSFRAKVRAPLHTAACLVLHPPLLFGVAIYVSDVQHGRCTAMRCHRHPHAIRRCRAVCVAAHAPAAPVVLPAARGDGRPVMDVPGGVATGVWRPAGGCADGERPYVGLQPAGQQVHRRHLRGGRHLPRRQPGRAPLR